MQLILRGVEKWCTGRELSVNPSKSEMVLFTRKYKIEALCPIWFSGKELELSAQVKYLGVILDRKLSWKLHIDAKCDEALICLHQLRCSVGKTWSISPKIAQWMYTAIIRPTITYAAVVWWSRVEQKSCKHQAGPYPATCRLTHHKCSENYAYTSTGNKRWLTPSSNSH